MFEIALFSVGSVLLGIVISIVAAIIMLLSVNIVSDKRHTPLSYITVMLFTLLLLVFNVLFIGLLNAKDKIIEYQNSTEYRLIQNGVGFLDQISPELSEVANALIGDDVMKDALEEKISQINEYLWIDGAICIVVFVLGVVLTNMLAMNGGRDYSRRSVGRPQRRTDVRTRREHR